MRELFTYHDRLNRATYIVRSFGVTVAFGLTLVLGGQAPLMWKSVVLPPMLGWSLVCVVLAAHAALSVRRLHDIGHSGWWLVLFAVAMAVGGQMEGSPDKSPVSTGTILVAAPILYLWFVPVSKGLNRFGPTPSFMPFNPFAADAR